MSLSLAEASTTRPVDCSSPAWSRLTSCSLNDIGGRGCPPLHPRNDQERQWCPNFGNMTTSHAGPPSPPTGVCELKSSCQEGDHDKTKGIPPTRQQAVVESIPRQVLPLIRYPYPIWVSAVYHHSSLVNLQHVLLHGFTILLSDLIQKPDHGISR